ncbi:MAG: hypothetical protein GY951_12490 [Psychromonas sp.]|nr:hypothetical protein [Alteromonadales bacterium]MCP5078859.1 hypothetical protein [Psychromonas sp.]
MKKLITILSLLLFVLTPVVSAHNERITGVGVTHSMLCSETMDCATTIQQCCVGGFSPSFYINTEQVFAYFTIPQRVAYIQYKQQPLHGTYKPLYRPPIV